MSVSKIAIRTEFAALTQPNHCPLGMYLFPTKDSLEYDGIIFIHRAPVVQFKAPIIRHPLIHPTTGILRIDKQFPIWRAGKLLDSLKVEDCVNLEAHRLYFNQTNLFVKLIEQSALLSITDSMLYPSTPNENRSTMKFSKLDEKTEESTKEKVYASHRKKLVSRDMNLME